MCWCPHSLSTWHHGVVLSHNNIIESIVVKFVGEPLKLGWTHSHTHIEHTWERWSWDLLRLRNHLTSWTYFPKTVNVVSIQMHGFYDSSEVTYAGEVHQRAIDFKDGVHVSLVMVRTKVAPIKQLLIPHLELRRRVILSKLLGHMANTLAIPPPPRTNLCLDQ